MKIYNDKDVYFIVELGQNHQGSLEIAKKMVDSLSGLPVSCFKTAKRDIDTCLSENQKNMLYENPNSFGKTYYEHRKHLELSKDDFVELKNFVENRGYDFISSFTDENSLDFLIEIGVSGLKIASQRLADHTLLKKATETKLPTIISTGMSNIEEIDTVVRLFEGVEKYLLQCTSIYPCNNQDLNLNVIPMFKERYGECINGYGFSGHHVGIAPDLAAYMLGSRIIERHYTLSRSMKGTDHAASLEAKGIENILKYINQMKVSLGSKTKTILDGELPTMKKLRGI